MGKVTKEILQETLDKIVEGKDLKKIKGELRTNFGFSGTQINNVILKAKGLLHEACTELKDILPDLNLYRLNQLYVSSVNLNPKDRAAIVKEMNTMIGLYKQEINVNMDYTFVIGSDDEVKVKLPGSEDVQDAEVVDQLLLDSDERETLDFDLDDEREEVVYNEVQQQT